MTEFEDLKRRVEHLEGQVEGAMLALSMLIKGRDMTAERIPEFSQVAMAALLKELSERAAPAEERTPKGQGFHHALSRIDKIIRGPKDGPVPQDGS